VTKIGVLPLLLFACMTLAIESHAADSEESHHEENHHQPNHIAFIAGFAFEEQADGHRQRGNVLGLEYIRRFGDSWAWGAAFELEAFGDSNKRHGVLAIPLSYFPTDNIRLFAAPGVEFRDEGEPDKPMFRLGAGYEFELTSKFSLSPEAQIDFLPGGTNVYVLALTLGYGF
jgi:hypothetical protein